MQLKNGEIIGLIDSINEISEKDLSIELAYKFYDNLSALSDKYQVYAKTLETLVKKEGAEDADDPKIREEVLKLLEMKTDVEIDEISKQELIGTGVKLSLSQLARLKPIIGDTDG